MTAGISMFGVELVSHTSDEVIVSEKSNTELLLLFWGGILLGNWILCWNASQPISSVQQLNRNTQTRAEHDTEHYCFV